MADSKITQLPLSPYALDKDLMVVVTGHLEEGAFPKNTKMPLSYIRRYVVRLNLLSSQQSGIASYYNSGLNILTTWTTGIHAVPVIIWKYSFQQIPRLEINMVGQEGLLLAVLSLLLD